MWSSPLENQDLGQFLHLKEQSARAVDKSNLPKYVLKNKAIWRDFLNNLI